MMKYLGIKNENTILQLKFREFILANKCTESERAIIEKGSKIIWLDHFTLIFKSEIWKFPQESQHIKCEICAFLLLCA